MLGNLTSLTGGGGMSASSSSSNEQKSSNEISSGTISVGGLTMMPKSSGFSSDNIVKGVAVVGVGLGLFIAAKKLL